MTVGDTAGMGMPDDLPHPVLVLGATGGQAGRWPPPSSAPAGRSVPWSGTGDARK
jgi:hypothetical protein